MISFNVYFIQKHKGEIWATVNIKIQSLCKEKVYLYPMLELYICMQQNKLTLLKINLIQMGCVRQRDYLRSL